MDAGWPETSSRETEEMKKSLNEIKAEFIGCRGGALNIKSKASVFGLPSLVHVKFGGGNGKVRLQGCGMGNHCSGESGGIWSGERGDFFSWRTQFGVLSLGLLFSLGLFP